MTPAPSRRAPATEFPRRPMHLRWMALLLVALAAAVRAGALLAWKAHLTDDRDDYLTVAGQYLAHGFWTSFGRFPNSFRPPLYPLLIAGIEWFGGGPLTVGWMQVALGAATTALTIFVGWRLGLGGAALLAGAMVAFDPLLIQYTTFPMTETLCAFSVIALIAALLPPTPGTPGESHSESNTPELTLGARQVGSVASAIAGAIFGLCALCRPTIMPAGALITAALLWQTRHKHVPWRQTVASIAAFAIAAAVVLSPWVVRNVKLVGAPVLSTTHGGYTLLLGNNEAYFHQVAARPFREQWRDSRPDRFQKEWFQNLMAAMERELGPAAGEIEQDQWMYRQVWQSIAAEPRNFLRACALRVLEFWNVTPLPPARLATPGWIVAALSAAYAIELVFFGCGIVSILRRRDARWVMTLIVILNFALVHIVYWSNMRMRAPIVPLIALVAARGAYALLTRRNPKKLVAETA